MQLSDFSESRICKILDNEDLVRKVPWIQFFTLRQRRLGKKSTLDTVFSLYILALLVASVCYIHLAKENSFECTINKKKH